MAPKEKRNGVQEDKEGAIVPSYGNGFPSEGEFAFFYQVPGPEDESPGVRAVIVYAHGEEKEEKEPERDEDGSRLINPWTFCHDIQYRREKKCMSNERSYKHHAAPGRFDRDDDGCSPLFRPGVPAARAAHTGQVGKKDLLFI